MKDCSWSLTNMTETKEQTVNGEILGLRNESSTRYMSTLVHGSNDGAVFLVFVAV